MKLSADSLLEMVSKNNAYSYQYSKKRTVYKVNSEAREISDEAASLRKSIRKLSRFDSNSTKKTVQKQLEKFTDEYNAILKNEDKIDDKTYKKSFEKLKSLVEDNKFKLKKIGFAYDEKSKKYKLDTDKFGKATDGELASVFSKEDSFMVQAEKLVKKIYKAADSKINTTQQQTHIGTVNLGSQQVLAGYAAANCVTITSNLKLLSQRDVIDDDVSMYMNEYLKAYADVLTSFTKCDAGADEAEQVQEFFDLYNNYSGELGQIGFGMGADEYTGDPKVIYTSQDWTTAGQDQINKLRELFGGAEDSYGVKAEALSKKIFAKAMKLETSGIVVDEYV